MNLKIEIEYGDFQSRTIRAPKGDFTVREQKGWASLAGEKYPREVTLQLPDGQGAYAPGVYEIGDASIYVDRYGAIGLRKALILVPYSSTTQKRVD